MLRRHLGDALTDKRAIERHEHAGFDVVKRGRVTIARPRDVRLDFLENMTGPRPHDHDAIGDFILTFSGLK